LLLALALAVVAVLVIFNSNLTDGRRAGQVTGREGAPRAEELEPVFGDDFVPDLATSAVDHAGWRIPSEVEGTVGSSSQRSLGRIRVLVRGLLDKAPLPGVLVTVSREEQMLEYSSLTARVAWEQRALTDASGFVSFMVESHVEFIARVDMPRILLQQNPDLWRATAHKVSRGVQPGEEREVRLEVDTGVRVVLHGRVVALEDRSPIRGALVSLVVGGEGSRYFPSVIQKAFGEGRQTYEDGRFQVEVPGWTGWAILIQREGKGPVLAVPEVGFTPQDPFEVCLSEEARIVGHVVRPPDGLSQLRVVAEVEIGHLVVGKDTGMGGRGSIRWEALLSSDGEFEFAELPPGVPVDIWVAMERGPALARSQVRELVAGEVRGIDLVIN
jgi:hypothetical protein